LHIATHGFFGAQSSQPPTASDKVQAGNRNSGPEQITDLHPGLSSGIALTGANQGSSVSDGRVVSDDGILTALEAAALDLSATEMVVLSACETGLGTSAGGEGLLSLQRAFQVAGAKSTVTSLWKVDDSATQSLMVEFYRNLWERHLGKLEAMRQAQIAMIERYDPKNQSLQDRGLKLTKPSSDLQTDMRLSPYFWAAFTLSGDWR
jgi:CHAT domain-containing protein